MTRKCQIFLMMIFCSTGAYSQIILQPNYALKSHETLEIVRIEITPSGTIISCSIENRLEGGQFCADRNIVITTPDLQRIRLVSAYGIPVCPDAYKFKSPGEKLDFTLTFPPLKEGTGWIDLIEDCQDNCFSFYGVTLDNDLNDRINEAVALAENGETGKSIDQYRKILADLEGSNHGMEGAIYVEIIMLLNKTGNKEEARKWFGKLVSSNVMGKERFIGNLKSRGIKF